jgi:succinoglycan biosynthesis transport protein ExoP
LSSPSDRDREVSLAKAVRRLAKSLTIEPLRKSNVISVEYSNRDPRLAAEVLQALAAEYTEKHLELHHSSGEFKFFDQQTKQYQQGLDQAQAKLTDFTKETGVVSAQFERDAALQQATEFDSMHIRLRPL